ncbi:MAG: hypothetical protein LBI60_06165, partial [Bacteroidales bacterium]|nr:hypothetical protein [Bacteroidales bacterium]
NEATIRKYIKDADKGDNAIFYFENKGQYQLLRNAISREAGNYMKKGKINEMPDIYYMKDGLLKLLWKK